MCVYGTPLEGGKRKVLYFWELFRKMFGTMARFKDRRSIRKYSRRGLPEGLIAALAGEASRAATMGNMQLYSLVVTEDGRKGRLWQRRTIISRWFWRLRRC